MDPASPSITFTTPVGASRVSPPGRTMQYSRSDPGPLWNSASCRKGGVGRGSGEGWKGEVGRNLEQGGGPEYTDFTRVVAFRFILSSRQLDSTPGLTRGRSGTAPPAVSSH
eukprot:6670394-Pyramimonas_sp.AAC.1